MTTTRDATADTTPAGDVLVLPVRGDLDMGTTGAFLRGAVGQLGRAPVSRVQVDMTEATFVDSTGIGALVELRTAAHAVGAQTRLVNVDDRTVRLLRIVGLDTVFLDRDADPATR